MAVTVLALPAPLSLMVAGFRDSAVLVGAMSSSLMVSVAGVTVRPAAVPSTVTVSAPSDASSCIGVMLNVPVALVMPEGMVMSKLPTVA